MKADISISDSTLIDFLELILENGPQTAYAMREIAGKSYGTTHLYLNEMEKRQLLKIYDEKPHKSGKTKKFFGPTITGIMGVFLYNLEFQEQEIETKDNEKEMEDQLRTIYHKWKHIKPFTEEIKEFAGFSEEQILNDPESETYFIRYMHFFIGLASQASRLQEESIQDKMVMYALHLATGEQKEQYISFVKFMADYSEGYKNSIITGVKKIRSDMDDILDVLK
ncbi:MAG: hypothetical protein OEL56_07535 [Nitrosopumilus sp.]|nr:hypothetical protein [Nitrosopumilus sp.]MDH3517024.1 hypothetical protein [Nitrosopumilus sp.]MDH3565629.1 hypothetical protein [Nitrosopumilus sp.]MDH5417358.1 hypothetical protein [Nitrosopumilus sp.]MDH5555181.1 hypothetical protein [Nitrosopumilus sp.]